MFCKGIIVSLFCALLFVEAQVDLVKELSVHGEGNPRDFSIAVEELTTIAPVHELEVTRLPENDLFFRTRNQTETERFARLYEWLASAGANISNVEAITYAKNFRGIHARKDLKANDVVISIPLSHVIWTPIVNESPIGRKLNERGFSSQKYWWLYSALFILIERYKVGSFWEPFLATYPDNFDNHPKNWPDSKLEWITGTYVAYLLSEERKSDFQTYSHLIESIPELKVFSFSDYCWATQSVSTRTYSISLNETNGDAYAMVPFADMFNHETPGHAKWKIDRPGFFENYLFADVPAGAQIYESYGHTKTQSSLFANYGFVSTQAGAPTLAATLLKLRQDDPLFNEKASRLTDSHLCQLHYSFSLSQECLSWARLAAIDDGSDFANFSASFPSPVYPLSLLNEEEASLIIADGVLEILDYFHTTEAEDARLLSVLEKTRQEDPKSLDWDYYSAVVVRKSEKATLQSWIFRANFFTALLDYLDDYNKDWEDDLELSSKVVDQWCISEIPKSSSPPLFAELCDFVMDELFEVFLEQTLP